MRTLRPIKLDQTEPLTSSGGCAPTEPYYFLWAHYRWRRSADDNRVYASVAADSITCYTVRYKVKKVICSQTARIPSLKPTWICADHVGEARYVVSTVIAYLFCFRVGYYILQILPFLSFVSFYLIYYSSTKCGASHNHINRNVLTNLHEGRINSIESKARVEMLTISG